jgi:hypothetical protein
MIVNMMVDLSASFATDDEARLLKAAGLSLEHRRGATECDLAWIQATFGGEWPTEPAAGWNWFARDVDGHPAGFCTYGQRSYRWWWIEHWIDLPDVGIFGPMGVGRPSRRSERSRSFPRRAPL